MSESAGFGLVALALRRLGKEDMRDFLRMLLMNVADVLDEHLEDERLRGLLAFDATLGSHLGPRSPTSLLGLYYRLTGEIAGAAGAQIVPAGGMGAVVAAIARAAEKAGVTVRTGAPVGRIIVEKGRAVGVVLASGEEIRARTVVSAANPRTTFLDLVGARELDTGFVRKVGNIRMKGDVAKLHLALDKPPQFPGVSAENHRGRLVIAPSPDHVERAFNPSKYGEFSPEPVMEITLPSLADPSLAPSGACVLSANVQYAPYALKEGWATGKPKFLDGDHGPARALCARDRQKRAPRRAADAGRHRGALSDAGRPLAPWRIAGRPDADVAAGLGRRRLRHADRAAVPVRRRLASGRRHLRRARPQRRPPHHRDEGLGHERHIAQEEAGRSEPIRPHRRARRISARCGLPRPSSRVSTR